MCIGNRDGGDDAIGPYVADRLKDSFTVLDCGTTPENYTSVVKKHNPKNLVIIDAAEMNLNPGEVRIVPKEKIGVMTISTHGIPVSILIGYLEQYVENIVFIGIQPKTMSGEMTETIKNTGDKVIELIKNGKIDVIEVI